MGPPPPLDGRGLEIYIQPYDLFHELNWQH